MTRHYRIWELVTIITLFVIYEYMTSTVAILGIDAADYQLCNEWNCSNLLLDSHHLINSVAYSIDVPATLEVWPSIATGLRPSKHGVILDPTDRDSENLLYRLGVGMNQLLPDPLRDWIHQLKEQQIGTKYPQTSSPTIFSRKGGSVYNWPGVTPCHDWRREGKWFKAVIEGNMSEQEFYKRHIGDVGKGVGWLAAQRQVNIPVAGVHVHMLDHMGHLYAERPDELRRAYEDVDALVGWLREVVDRLIIISDHGMQSSVFDDSNPGVHSWRSFIATTGEYDSLPDSVLDVNDWILELVDDENNDQTKTTADAPIEHLQDLGYI